MKNKLIVNSIYLSGSQLIARGVGFLYFIFLARSLSVENFGILSWVLGFVYNFFPLADFGLERMVLKYLPRNPSEKQSYLSRLLPLRLILAISAVFIAVIAGFVIGVEKSKLFYIFVFGLSLLPYNLFMIVASIQNALEKMRTFALVNLVNSILSAVFGIIFILLGFPILYIFIGYILSSLVVWVGLCFFIKKIDLKVEFVVDIKFWKKLIKEAWIFALIFFTAVFYLRISLILVGQLLGDYWAGIYGAASKFVEAGILIPQSIAIALFPLSSKMMVIDRQRLKGIYLKSLTVLFIISIPFALTMYFGSQYIMPLVYGADYIPSIPVFSLMGILMMFYFVNSLPGNIIQNSDKFIKFLPFAILNFLVALIAGLIIIPKVGVIGGVWAMIIGEAFGLIINNIFVFKILKA